MKRYYITAIDRYGFYICIQSEFTNKRKAIAERNRLNRLESINRKMWHTEFKRYTIATCKPHEMKCNEGKQPWEHKIDPASVISYYA